MIRRDDIFESAVLAFLAIVYFGIGALAHATFYSAQFDWTSAGTWGWMIAWPVALVISFYVVIFAIVAFLLILGAAIAILANGVSR